MPVLQAYDFDAIEPALKNLEVVTGSFREGRPRNEIDLPDGRRLKRESLTRGSQTPLQVLGKDPDPAPNTDLNATDDYVVVKRKGRVYYLPFTSTLVLSLALTLLARLI